MKVVILAGGGGTRLFPLSRSCYPKQFLKIGQTKSLLTLTIERFLGLTEPKNIVIVTNLDYYWHVKAELSECGAEQAHVIVEPLGKNTAPAIALAMSYCRERLGCQDTEAVFVAPADHIIDPKDKFIRLIAGSIAFAANGCIVTFGITPTKPETGYGYIKTDKILQSGLLQAAAFCEKPDLAIAERYLEEGSYYWNAGMFLFQIATMEKELRQHAPKIYALYAQGYQAMTQQFCELPSISIDYAVAEKSARIDVVPLTGIYWNDIGSWDAVAETFADKQGNMFSGDIVHDNCKNTMVFGSERLVVTQDLDNILVVDTPDVLLVTKKGASQKIKEVVTALKAQNRKEVAENLLMYRPWGEYQILAQGPSYKVKLINVKPGAKISLQLHHYRSEHWTVIGGQGKILLGDKEILCKVNESAYIPVGMRHRLTNPFAEVLSIIEVQNGEYLDEDDIERFDDDYERK